MMSEIKGLIEGGKRLGGGNICEGLIFPRKCDAPLNKWQKENSAYPQVGCPLVGGKEALSSGGC